MRILRPVFAVVCPLVLGISLMLGCGGGGSHSTPPVPPTISAQPTNLTVDQGQAAGFSVTATGTAPLSCQWMKNGTAITGATGTSHSIASAQATDAAAYTVVVTNVAGSVTSDAAALSVNLPPTITGQPANLTVNQGQIVSFSVTAAGTAPLSYQWQKNGTAISGATGASFSIVSAQANDAAAYTVMVTNMAGSATSSAAALSVNLPPTITSQPLNVAVNQGQVASFSVTAAGTAPLSYQWQKNGTAISGATGASFSIVSAQAMDAAAYKVVVTNVAGSATSSAAALSVNLPPAITSQPVSLMVYSGQSARFSVTVTGTAPFSYQWQKNGSAINGATGNSYSITTTQADDAGPYSVTVSNSVSSLASTAASLTVLPKPTIQAFTVSPSPIPIGGSGVLSWTVTGATTLSVDQGVGSAALESGTKNVSPATTTTYTMTATNGAGSVTATATLNVDATPFQITSFIASPSVVEFGGTSSLGWIYSGLPLSFTLDRAAVSGPSSLVAPVRRQTFTLAGSNGAASDSKTLKVAARGLDLVAGSTSGAGMVDGQGSAARFDGFGSLAADTNGNVYLADPYGDVIRKITPTGMVSTMAGTPGISGYQDGPANLAKFATPYAVAVDTSGVLYVADTLNYVIRKIALDGTVSTLAGLPGTPGGANGKGSEARFFAPCGIAVDKEGNLLVTDSTAIRKLQPDGTVTTLAGVISQPGSTDGLGSEARFSSPVGIAIGDDGYAYVADQQNSTLRKISPSGAVSTLAGLAGHQDLVDGTGSDARFYWPNNLCIDGAGNLFVTDPAESVVRMVTPSGQVKIVAGSPVDRRCVDGQGISARFTSPSAIAIGRDGVLYVAEYGNYTIRRIDSNFQVSTFAGSPDQVGQADGQGSEARFSNPSGLLADADGGVIVVDKGNVTLRRISRTGVVTTWAGSTGWYGSRDGYLTSAQFWGPSGLAKCPDGSILLADTSNQTIRKISTSGVVSTLAGSPGQTGSLDGQGAAARFSFPTGICVDPSGNIFIADFMNSNIRKITPEGLVSTFAGYPGVQAYHDGSGLTAFFNCPSGLTFDSAGNLYVADTNNSVIRKITPDGKVTTFAGTAQQTGREDGLGSAARFNYPKGIVVDPQGNLFVADTNNHTIRKITPDGQVTTIAGTAGQGTFVPGALPGNLVFPTSIALTGDGDLLVTCNNGIVQITAP